MAAYLGSQLVTNLGWTLFHSVWQIAIVAGLLSIILRLLRDLTPDLRYFLSVLALLIAVTVPVVTYFDISTSSTENVGQTRNGPVSGLSATASDRSFADEGSIGTESSPASSSRAENSGFAYISRSREYISRNIPSVLPFAVGVWFFGIAIFSFRLTGGVWHLRRYRSQGVQEVTGPWSLKFRELCEQLQISHRVSFFSSTIVQTPIAIGTFKPLIIVPASVFLQVGPAELETIIAHELIHIRRYDPLINILQTIFEILFFYHPGIWWISARIRTEREFAADLAVVNYVGSRALYASALANLEEIRFRQKQQPPQLAAAANGGNLMVRIERILDKKTEVNSANSAWTAGLALLLTSVILTALFSFSATDVVNANTTTTGRKIAIGFVSIPPIDRTANPPKDSDATARLLIEKLKAHKVPAVGFVQGGMISDGEKLFPVRANIVRLWRDAGFEIGMGGFKHIWFSHTPYDEYLKNVVKNETVVKQILDEKGQKVRYFSYPYLNTGGNRDDRVRFENWLRERKYQYIPYTFDNDEWLYSYVYDFARNKNDLNTMKMVRTEFVDYMQKMLTYYEQYSQDLFKREIPQTMVLTPSRLVADASEELFGIFEKRGYSFVPMDEALADEAYKSTESIVISDSGISWFKRWASEQGRRLREEPKISDEVDRIWKANKPQK